MLVNGNMVHYRILHLSTFSRIVMTSHRSEYHRDKVEKRLEMLCEVGLDGEPIYSEKELLRVRAYLPVCQLRILLKHCIDKDISPTSFIKIAIIDKLNKDRVL